MSENKWHKVCGGKVVYREGTSQDHFEFAGMCLKCNEYPIIEEDIIFEIDKDNVERFYNEFDKWNIVSKQEICEKLET